MNKGDSFIALISNTSDLDKVSNNKKLKYINLNITNPNKEVLDYFKNNGYNYSFSEAIDNKNGYIYVDYNTFYKSQMIIKNIIDNMPNDFSDLEKSRYIYIQLGKNLGYDINILPEKNESFNFSSINTINNIWGAIASSKITNISIVKIYYYLCRLLNIDCEIIMTSDNGYLCNKLEINNKTIIVDLMKDIPFIQSGFQTKFFGSYNEDKEMDKKIKYIKDDYNDKKIDKILKNIDYSRENIVEEILIKTQDIINVYDIKPIELGIIYDIIFTKYCPNYDIAINNLYINDIYNNKDHFILISYNNMHYSYSYAKYSFISVTNEHLINNIKNNKIGIYLDEFIPNLNINTKGVI